MIPLPATGVDARRVPGEQGIWVLIIGELLVFTLFFLTILYYRGTEPDVFAQSQPLLNRGFGLTNTLLLLTSSLFVAVAVHRVRAVRTVPWLFFAGAIACGAGFVAIKLVEYGDKIHAGIGFATNDFFMLYFAFTGIHLLHVLLGLGVLSWLAAVSRRTAQGSDLLVLVESGAIFWHLVDLLWIVLFALFYLVPSNASA